MSLTPLHINLLLHYHTTAEKYHRPSIAATDYTGQLLKLDLIEPDERPGSGFTTTARGRAFVERLLSTELPVLRQFWGYDDQIEDAEVEIVR